jgi:hypothetical protein
MYLQRQDKEIKKLNNCSVSVIIFFFLSLISQIAFAQQNVYTLSGLVRDSETKQPLPSASVRLLESSIGTATNVEGMFKILIAQGRHQIAISYIGYHSDTLDVNIDSPVLYRDVFLRPSTISVSDVVVFGDDRDPAEAIILEAIAQKHRIQSQLRTYRFDAYTKTEARIKDPKKERTDTVIMAIFETQTSCSWKAPDSYKEVITARRQSANFTSKQNMFTVDKIPNLNDDIIVLDPYSVVGPTAINALDYYTYKMLDTLAMDNYRVFRIQIKPKDDLRPLFDGVISIADKSFMVMQVDVKGNDALDLSPMIDTRLQQQFSLFEHKFWFPVESKITFAIEIPLAAMYIEQYSLMHNYEINNELDDAFFDNFQISVLPTADQVDSTYWQNVNTLPLTLEETNAYRKLDSIVIHAGFFPRALMTLTNFSLPWKEVEPTSFSDYFHFNRVEGAYLGIGVKLIDVLPFSDIMLRAGYAFAEDRGKYTIDVEKFFTDRKMLSLGAGLYRKTSYREGEEFLTPGEITLLSLFGKNDPVDYFEVAGWSLYSHLRPGVLSSIEVRFRDEQYSSRKKTTDFSIFYGSDMYRLNEPIVDGTLRSGSIAFSFDTRKFLIKEVTEDFDKSQNNFWCTINVEHSQKEVFQSDFQFTRYSGSFNFYVLTTLSGSFCGNFRFGYSTGHLPPQKIFDLYGSTSDLVLTTSLRTISRKEFAGDRLASLILEHNFGNLPFRALSLSFMKSLDLILFTGTAWTDLSFESKSIQPVHIQTSTKVINEIGLGFGKLFSLFRLDFAWRVTGNTKKDFTITLGSSLR